MSTGPAIAHIFISPGHNFVGHHGGPPGDHPTLEVAEVECVAGHGLRGDRYFDHRPDYKGQITFFALETHLDLCHRFGRSDRSPGVYRRNVITRGLDLNSLIGTEFELQGVRFSGVAECSPCQWMNLAFAPGAEQALACRGGLRARILSDGILRAAA